MAEKKKKKKHEKPVVVNAAQSNVNISDFYKGMVIDQNGDMFCVMEVIPSPFFQKKVEEQNKIVRRFGDFLRQAPDSLHIKSITVKANLKEQIADIEKVIDSKDDIACNSMRREYFAHLRIAKESTADTSFPLDMMAIFQRLMKDTRTLPYSG